MPDELPDLRNPISHNYFIVIYMWSIFVELFTKTKRNFFLLDFKTLAAKRVETCYYLN